MREELKMELAARGFRDSVSPKGTMSLDDEYLSAIDPAGLLEQLVARREKIFRSAEVVGLETAKAGYEDVVAAIEAVKALIRRLVLPS